jgi:uncharacterized protein YjbJ (UPF0337 family)
MNFELIAAYCREIAARTSEAWGEFSGDPMRSANGRRARIEAIALQRKAIAKEESRRQLADFRQRNRNWHF